MDKPENFTSFDVVAKLRGICATRRIGHSGTLDPMATGVLPVFIGEATKAVDMQQNHDKVYEACFVLGIKTDTADITGTVLEKQEVPNSITTQSIINVLKTFEGEQSQIPPMYSAVKINGIPLYKMARKGVTVERKERKITIHAIEYIESINNNEHKIRVHCSKGTYVRTLIEDIAIKLGTVAALSQLRRTKAGFYDISKAVTFEQVQKAKDENNLNNLLLGIDTVFEHLPSLTVNSVIYKRLLNGAPTYKFNATNGDYKVFVKTEKNTKVFVGICSVEQNILSAKKIFIRQSEDLHINGNV